MHSALSLPSDRAAVVAVRRPVRRPARGDTDDDRIDEAVDLLDRLVQPLGVGRGEVALVGRGLDLLQREQAEDLPVLADGLAERGQHRYPRPP